MYNLLVTRYQYYFECSIIQEHYVVPNNLKSIIETHAGQEIHDSFKKENNESINFTCTRAVREAMWTPIAMDDVKDINLLLFIVNICLCSAYKVNDKVLGY